MKSRSKWLFVVVVSPLLATALGAQAPASLSQSVASPAPSTAATDVPRLIKFNGTLLDEQEQALKGPVGVTFALYAQQNGGAALWMETQNVKTDANGNYTVLLGANTAGGVPAELFVSGEARWLGIQVGQQPEHERILLVSVPYALKAGDAETLGGKPLSSFVLNESSATASSAGSSPVATSSPAGKTQTTTGASSKTSATPQAATPCSSVTSDGTATVNSFALFTAPCNIESSLMTQALINGFPGVNLVGNNAGLLLNGTGTHQVTVTSATTGVSGRLGQDANGFFFASDTNGKSVRFLTNNGTLNEWMRITSAGNVGIGTATPTAKLEVNGNLVLPSSGTATPSGGFSSGPLSMGASSFNSGLGVPVPQTLQWQAQPAGNNTSSASGQMSLLYGSGANTPIATGFSIASNGVVTGTGAGLTGTLSLPNTTSGGTGGVIMFGGFPFLHNFGPGNDNTFLGLNSGNFAMTGAGNTAVGNLSLAANTTGAENIALGGQALRSNTTGLRNTAVGFVALFSNTTGTDNTAVGQFALQANTGSDNTALGTDALSSNTTANGNTAVGFTALNLNSTGISNTAMGANALSSSTTANQNTAVGWQALSNATAGSNTAVGADALVLNTTGFNNTAVGTNTLGNNTAGGNNTAVGEGALQANSVGLNNTAVGLHALAANTTGSTNIAIGDVAGVAVTTGSNNILIGNGGTSADSNLIRIGTQGTQNATFIAGISGETTGGTGAQVLVDGNGQLGTISSSRRFKYEIADMDEASSRLLRLRPVTFRYKQAQTDGSHPLQYGLIAEEVAEVYPELVQRARSGEVTTVLYHMLPAMLLNELQKQQRQIEAQEQQIEAQQEQLQAQAAQLAQLKVSLEKQSEKRAVRISSAQQ